MARNVFTPVIGAALLLVMAAYMAVAAGITGVRFLPSLNDRRPALAQAEPVQADAPPRLSRRVIIVIVDGLALRHSFGLPFLDSLRRRGVDAAAEAHYPTFSRPNHVAVVTGVPPAASGVRTNHYRHPVLIDSLMDRARAEGLASAFAANNSDGLPLLFTRPLAEGEVDPDDYDGEFLTDFEQAHYTTWRGGFVKAARKLLELRYPVVILLPADVDDAGHLYGADSDEYLEASRKVDRELSRALDSVDWSRDTVIVTADHGHTDLGGHGGLEADVLEVPLILAGAGVRPGAAIGEAALIDVAPTAAAVLGLPAPGHSLGRTLTDVLLFDPDARSSIERADELRILRNVAITRAARDAAAARVARTRMIRLPIVGVLALLGLGLIWAGRRFSILHIDWRVLLIALPAFPATYYALLGLFGQSFSPSMVSERGDVEGLLFRFGLISTVVHVMASWVALRGRVVLRDRLAAANALTACGLFIGLLPAGLSWALITPPYVEVPGPTLMVLVPATFVAIACYALAAAVTITLEIVIFFARAVDPRVRMRRLERAMSLERERLEREP